MRAKSNLGPKRFVASAETEGDFLNGAKAVTMPTKLRTALIGMDPPLREKNEDAKYYEDHIRDGGVFLSVDTSVGGIERADVIPPRIAGDLLWHVISAA